MRLEISAVRSHQYFNTVGWPAGQENHLASTVQRLPLQKLRWFSVHQQTEFKLTCVVHTVKYLASDIQLLAATGHPAAGPRVWNTLSSYCDRARTTNISGSH